MGLYSPYVIILFRFLFKSFDPHIEKKSFRELDLNPIKDLTPWYEDNSLSGR